MSKRSLFGLLVFAGACSALIDPDPSQLGNPTVPMECPTDCDDGVECTVDRCEGTVCVNERDNSRCGDTERCDMVMGCVDASCTGDMDCDDGLACNGVESCNDGRCEEGAALVCDDALDCTIDRCDNDTGECSFETNNELCDDGVPCTHDVCSPEGCQHEADNALCDDGFCFQGAQCTPSGCEGGMARVCDDRNACTVDACNAEAMMCIYEMEDGDGDGFGPNPECNPEFDCNDDDPTIYPGAEEVCDDIDQDCDGDNTDGCVPVQPDTCDTAQILELPGDAPVSVNGMFMGYNDDYSSECSGGGGPDAVFVLNIEAGMDYIIDTVGSGADTVLAVSPDCGSWEFAGRGCNDDIVFNRNRASRIYLRALSESPTRQVYILLDQYPSAASPGNDWTLNVMAVPASAAECSGRLNISQGGSVVGFIGPMAPSNSFTSCQSGIGTFGLREAYFRIRPQADQTRVRAWADDFDPALGAFRNCIGGQITCDQGGSGGSGPDITWDVEREEYVVVLDGADGADGNYYTLEYDP